MNEPPPQYLYDVPRLSCDLHTPSVSRSPSANYQNCYPTQSRSQNPDSGCCALRTLPILNIPPVCHDPDYETIDKVLDGPPVRLDMHPSIPHHGGSRMSMHTNSTTHSSGSCSNSELEENLGLSKSSCSSSIDDKEGHCSIIRHIHGDSDLTPEASYSSIPSNQFQFHAHYMVQALDQNAGDQHTPLVRPAIVKENEYICMQPASILTVSTTPAVPQADSRNASDNKQDTLQPSFPNGRLTHHNASLLTCETLPIISEDTKIAPCKRKGQEEQNIHKIRQELIGATLLLDRPNYENCETAPSHGRRGLHEKMSHNAFIEQFSPHDIEMTGKGSAE